MKKLLSLFTAVLFAGSMFAVDAEILKGETNSYDDVTINGQAAVKMGKSSAGGDMYINVGAGAKILTLHAVAWNKEGGAKVFIKAPEGVTATPAEIELVANENIAGSAKAFELADEEAYKFQIALDGVAAPCTFTLESEKRAIVWAVTYETDGEITPPEPADTYTVAGAPESVFGSYWDPTDKNNDMVLKDGLYKWEKKVYLTAGTKIEFKIVKNHSWDVASYPDDNVTATVDEDGEYIFPISFQTENNQVFAALHKVEAVGDPTNCAEAAEAALSVSENNEPFNDGKEYTIQGYVTGIKTAYNEQYNNISFWMADVKDGGEVLQAFRCVPEAADKLPEVGDLVKVTGQLTKYGETPEFAAGCTVVIIEKGEVTPPEPVEDPTNCAEAAEAALSVSENNEPFNGGKEYTIRGYVTGIKTEYSEQYNNISFWMADDAEGGEVLQAFRCVPEAADRLPEVGDLVEVTGVLTKYGSTPEFAAGCTCVILAKQGVENTAATVKAVKVIRDGQVFILKGDKIFNVLGTEMK